ncbi:MAG: alpha/beta hydrolase [Clostridia bacterium]|nr:alpha/beta hydrolase [Clostridia bacterium]
MKTFSIQLTENAVLDCYLHEYYKWDIVGKVNESHPAIIVCPGGGYTSLSCSEAEPVALTFLKEGFSTFVLNYSTGENCRWPNALIEVLSAIWQVRKNAKEWYINPDAIAVMGFSAGAGMAAIAATQWNTEDAYKKVGAPNAESVKPNAAVLGYGAMDASLLMKRNIFDDKEMFGENAADHFDPVKYIGKHTPPTFLWHGRRDSCVPSFATVDYARKLDDLDISYELHVFDFANHALTVFNRNTDSDNYDSRELRNVGMWVEMCADWLMTTFGY